jgi:hypothetical protein
MALVEKHGGGAVVNGIKRRPIVIHGVEFPPK